MIILYLLSLFFHSIIQWDKVLHVRLLLLAETIYAWQTKTKKKERDLTLLMYVMSSVRWLDKKAMARGADAWKITASGEGK